MVNLQIFQSKTAFLILFSTQLWKPEDDRFFFFFLCNLSFLSLGVIKKYDWIYAYFLKGDEEPIPTEKC